MDNLYDKYIEAQKHYDKLSKTTSMSEIADIVESFSEEMAKLVLKKFIYAQDNYLMFQEKYTVYL